MLERLAGHEYYCFLNGFSGYFQIPIAPEDQEKTTFTCPYGTFAYKRMPFGLCNAPAAFQRCMIAIFHELIEDSMEVFMDDFLVFGSSFDHCLKNLKKMLKRCKETNLVLNWEKMSLHDLEKLTKVEIRDLFPEEQLMAIFDKNNEPCMLIKSYEDAWPEMRQHKFFDNVTTDHPEDIMASSLQIVYGKACHLLVELEHKTYWAIKNCNMDLTKAGENWFLQINELDEMRLDAYESSITYKERTKRWHDKRIKSPINYEKGDKVLLFNSRLRLFPRKLKSRWYGPFSVSKDMKNKAIELHDEEGSKFIINKQRVKPYQKNLLDTNKYDVVTLGDE
ncbi:reverse transcriptase domain-containing protein [Tanacetum coccineum]